MITAHTIIPEDSKQFSFDCGFTHISSSAHYPESDGEAEKAVQTSKNGLKKNEGPYKALMINWTTQWRNSCLVEQMLLSRQIDTDLPTSLSTVELRLVNTAMLKQKERNY